MMEGRRHPLKNYCPEKGFPALSVPSSQRDHTTVVLALETFLETSGLKPLGVRANHGSYFVKRREACKHTNVGVPCTRGNAHQW